MLMAFAMSRTDAISGMRQKLSLEKEYWRMRVVKNAPGWGGISWNQRMAKPGKVCRVSTVIYYLMGSIGFIMLNSGDLIYQSINF